LSEEANIIAPETTVEQYDHINIMEIDPSFKPISEGFYTFQINKAQGSIVTPKAGKNAGNELLVLKFSLTLVGDDQYSGRKFWPSFWANNPVDLRNLRKLAEATAVTQTSGQTLTEYTSGFELLDPPAEFKCLLDPPAEFKCLVQIGKNYKTGEPENVFVWNTTQPV